jgi:hypothetical protein
MPTFLGGEAGVIVKSDTSSPLHCFLEDGDRVLSVSTGIPVGTPQEAGATVLKGPWGDAVMSARVSIVRAWVIAGAATVGLAAAGAALAGPGGGGGHAMGGGGHAAVGGGFHGGVARGGFYGGYRGGYRGGYYGGYRGGAWAARPYYGWHGYYGGWRGGWGCCGWGAWPWVGLGWAVATLPYGYSTLWWGGVPYYYANNYYYVWDSGAGQYQAVEPPSQSTAPPGSAGAPPASAASNTWTDLYAYPKAGQSTEQQAKDRDECHKWAVSQTGFDPAQPTQENQNDWAAKREGYLRAEGACLTARNYSVK